jgi:hypothetical protein
MERYTTPESVNSITQGNFGIYRGDHIYKVGTPYIIVTVNDVKGEPIAESFAMVPKRLFPPPFKYGEMPSQGIVAFDGACQHLLHIHSEMDPENRGFFPTPLKFEDADRADMFHTKDYLSPLEKIWELTLSDALKTYIDTVKRRHGMTG